MLRCATAISLVASSAFGMTSFDTRAPLTSTFSSRSESLDRATEESVESLKKPISRPVRSEPSRLKKTSAKPAVAVSPEWSMKSCFGQTENGSYLSQNKGYQAQTLNDRIFLEAHTNRAFRAEYENRVAADEARANAGLNESYDEKTRFQAMKDFAQRAFSSISKMHLKVETNRLKKAAENQSFAREPVAAAVLAASLYTGRAMNFKVAEGIRVSSRAALKNKAASVSLHIPESGLTSTVAYSRDAAMTAQLSKTLTKSVSAIVDSGSKGTAQLVYSVSF
jgi:hypothetical protein